MKILITGGGGFLGQSLARLLITGDHKVVFIGRNPINSAGFAYEKADITSKSELMKVREKVGKVDKVIHLAAAVPKTSEEDVAETMIRTNVVGTMNLLEVFGPDISGFVYASTAEVYGLPEKHQLIEEDDIPKPLTYYGASKLAGEAFCDVYGKKNNLNVAILRFTLIYGPGDTINRAIPNFIKQALAGEEPQIYGGDELRDYLYLDDAAEALFLAVTKDITGTFNIGSGTGQSIKDVAELIIKKINPKLSPRILPRQKKAADIVLSVERANEQLGFTAKKQFSDGLEEQITWHKKN